MRFTDNDKAMVDRLIRGFRHDLEELQHDQYGHAEIVSDLKESCREKIDWLEAFQKRMEQEPQYDGDGKLRATMSEPEDGELYSVTRDEMLEFAEKMTYPLDDHLVPCSRETLRSEAWLLGYTFGKSHR